MKQPLTQANNHWGALIRRGLSLFAVFFGLSLLGLVPQFLPQASLGLNMLPLAFALLWVLWHPNGLSPLWLLLLGLSLDMVLGTALCVNTVTCLLLAWLVRSQRRFLMTQHDIVLCLSLLLVLSVGQQMQWVLQGLVTRQWGAWGLSLPALLWQAAAMPWIIALARWLLRWQSH